MSLADRSLRRQMHLGYHELRKLIDQFNEQRRQGHVGRYGPTSGNHAHNIPSHSQPPPPSAPSAGPPQNGLALPPNNPLNTPSGPHTPVGQIRSNPSASGSLPYESDSMIPGHGDKRKREAMELADAARSLGHDGGEQQHRSSGDDSRDRKRHRSRSREAESDRDRRHRDRSRERYVVVLSDRWSWSITSDC